MNLKFLGQKKENSKIDEIINFLSYLKDDQVFIYKGLLVNLIATVDYDKENILLKIIELQEGFEIKEIYYCFDEFRKDFRLQEKYSIIYCDPPWKFKNHTTGGQMIGGASYHYNTETIKNLKKMDINSITEKDCVLFMWWVASQPKEAIELVEEWGFEIKTMTAFNWVKTTKTGKLFFGMGFWTRAGSENCLIAIKGKPKKISSSIRSVHLLINEKHSKKPQLFRDLIVQMFGNLKKLEMFAREKSEGWDVFGNQIENSIKIKLKL